MHKVLALRKTGGLQDPKEQATPESCQVLTPQSKSPSGGLQRAAQEQVIIFVNPKSGGGRAGEYIGALNNGGPPHEIKLKRGLAHLRAFDLRDGEPGKKPGFHLLKELSEEGGTPIRVMVAGGDGTVMWAISEMEATDVNLQNVVVGHIPFGTGNDFARSTGWGPTVEPGDLIGSGWKRLKGDVRQWLAADIVDFDVWEVEVATGAGFAFVHGGQRCLTEEDKVKHGVEELVEEKGSRWRMKKRFVNYFSLGQVCRAGLSFEKRRTPSRFGNNLRYALEGVKKLSFQQAPTVSDVARELVVSSSSSNVVRLTSTATSVQDDETQVPSSRCSLHSDSTDSIDSAWGEPEEPSPSSTSGPSFSKSYSVNLEDDRTSAELLFLNIPSFAGGADPWAWSSGEERFCEEEEELSECRQDMGDGRLEVVSYSSCLGAAIDIANGKLRTPGRGAGQRIASAAGPFKMSFKSPDKAKYTSADGRFYLQADGEFFVAHEPEEVQIRHWRTVKVLARQDQDTVRFGCLSRRATC